MKKNIKVLALESSATAVSVALCEDESLIAQSFLHNGLTHSQTLLPMVESLLQQAGWTMQDIDLLGIAAGPGSFTGLRIGMATAKGLAWLHDTPCAACSTLEAMAWNAVGMVGELYAVMDARRGQVYHAHFSSDGSSIRRLSPDRAISLEALAQEVKDRESIPIFIGDGARVMAKYFDSIGQAFRLAPQNIRLQTAWGVARLSLELVLQGKVQSADHLAPQYLRLSQAERERQARLQKGDAT